MIRIFKLLLLMMFMGIITSYAQTSCTDMNVYPMTKNTGTTGSYTLRTGYEEQAAQTYYYSGPGNITQVRVYGTLATGLAIPLNIVIYSTDANGRPKTALKSVSYTWWRAYNTAGYRDISVGAVSVSSNFAIAVEIPSGTPPWSSFAVAYNGDGDGRGEDLASIAGTSTGYNWTSAKNTFKKDGDFYILPVMTNFITADFSFKSECGDLNTPMSFINTSMISADSMFNKIANPKYSGSNYIYTWDFGDNSAVSHAANPTHTYTKAGVYNVKLTATLEGWGNTCSDVYQRPVSVGLALSISKSVNVMCSGSSTGSITAAGTGGAAPYKYSLNGVNYTSSGEFTGLPAAIYTVYLMDSFGCSKTAAVTITEPAAITPLTYATTNSTCGNANGALTVIAKGGTGSLKYSIDGTNFQGSGSFTGLAAGHKTITIKDSLGCQAWFSADIKDAAGPKIKVTGYNHISCNGNNDGYITVTSTGGTGTPKYSIDGTSFQASGEFKNLRAGSYGITVKDSNGCIDALSFTLVQPKALLFNVVATPVTCNGSNDGTLTIVNATGGTGAYAFSLDNSTYQSGTAFSGLSAGNYSVYMKDAYNCMVIVNATISQPAKLTASATATAAACYGADNGSISVSASGGTAPYAYSIDGIHFQPVGMFSNLSAGTYSFTIKDANGCFYMATSATVTQPSAITASFTTTRATCGNSNGAILASASGGSGTGYKYSINEGASFNTTGSFSGLKDSTYEILVTDSKSCEARFSVVISTTNGPQITTINHTDVSCNGGYDGSITIGNVSGGTGTLSYSIDGINWQSASSFTGLSAGSYIVRVKDAVGCTGAAGITVIQPSAIKITVNTVNPSCYFESNGSVTVSAAGGSGTLAYSIDGIYYQSSNVFTKLPAGNYIVFVRDAGHCMNTQTFSLTEPKPITFAYTGTLNVTCHGSKNGSISVYAQGGTGALKYSIGGTNFQTSNVFTGLSGGIYGVYVKDANGCMNQEFVTIGEPDAISASAEIQNVSCSGGDNGAIVLTVNGGITPYSYEWSNFAASEDIFNLKAGIYNVTVTDHNGCKYNNSYTVTQPEKPLIVNGAITDTRPGQTTGSIVLTLTGGTGIYTFRWSNGAITKDISGLAAGEYTVIVMDISGCQVSETFLVSTSTGVDENGNPVSALSVYPNPARDMVTIDAGELKMDRISISTIEGRELRSEIVNESKTTLNTADMPAGIYILTCRINGNDYRTRFSIQR